MGHGRAGNAFRSSFKNAPLPGPTNIYVEPGKNDINDLVHSLGSGIYIQNIMGMHTADPVSGDFSVGFNGYEISGGERAGAICEMTISGNIVSLLEGIGSVGSDMRFVGRVGSPAVIVDGLSVSGR
jgi:PmbA protein